MMKIWVKTQPQSVLVPEGVITRNVIELPPWITSGIHMGISLLCSKGLFYYITCAHTPRSALHLTTQTPEIWTQKIWVHRLQHGVHFVVSVVEITGISKNYIWVAMLTAMHIPEVGQLVHLDGSRTSRFETMDLEKVSNQLKFYNQDKQNGWPVTSEYECAAQR